MEKILAYLEDFSAGSVAIRLALALLLSGIIGLERVKHGRQAGMRTHIFVAVGACLASLIGVFATEEGFSTDPMRLGAQVVSGIGFLGAGIILIQNKSRIVGLTTSAGLWNTAVLGLALGIGFYEGALICFFISLITALILPKIEYWLSKNDQYSMLYIELSNSSFVNPFYDELRASGCGEIHQLEIVPPRSSCAGKVGVQLTLTLPKKRDVYELEKKLCKMSGVDYAVVL